MKLKPIFFIPLLLIFLGCSRTVTPEPHSQHDTPIPPALSEQVQPTQEPATNGDVQMAQNLEMTIDEFGNETDHFLTKSGKKITFHAIIHGSIWFEYDGIEFQVDPVSKLNDKETDYSKYPKADYILITHEHFDHLDETAINSLEKPDTTIITNENCAAKLKKGEIMHNGDKKMLRDDIQIEAVPAYNATKGHEQFHPKGRDNGFILTLDGLRIYISGDTEDIPEMADFKDIDIAFMSCNLPYTMAPVQLLHAANMVNPKVLFPYHYSETSMFEVNKAFLNKKIDLRIRKYQ